MITHLTHARLATALAVALSMSMAGCSAPSMSPDTPDASLPSTTVTTERPSTPTTVAVTPAQTPEGLDAASTLVPSGDDDLDAGLTALIEFVIDARQRPFRRPVAVEMMDDASFEAVVLAGFDERSWVAALEHRRDLLVAMGLWPTDVSYIDAARVSMQEGVIGLYVPSTERLYVRGTVLTPFVQRIVVHELTHALDDQWFDLEDPAANDDASFALGSLAEGSSTWVEEQFVDRMSAADKTAASRQEAAEAAAMEIPEMPIAVTEIGESVYSLGHTYVSALVAAGGVAALDQALENPPSSTESLIHPDRTGPTARRQELPPPDTGGRVRAEGVLGEQGTVEVLNGALAPAVARAAADGWAGDRYVIVERGDIVCVVLDVVADSPADEQEMHLAWTRWAVRQPDASVIDRPGGGVRIEACTESF